MRDQFGNTVSEGFPLCEAYRRHELRSAIHDQAKDQGFDLEIIDAPCPHCGLKPTVRLKRQKRNPASSPTRQP
jgi:hypothetical protein